VECWAVITLTGAGYAQKSGIVWCGPAIKELIAASDLYYVEKPFTTTERFENQLSGGGWREKLLGRESGSRNQRILNLPANWGFTTVPVPRNLGLTLEKKKRSSSSNLNLDTN